jgi:hypothetical protein
MPRRAVDLHAPALPCAAFCTLCAKHGALSSAQPNRRTDGPAPRLQQPALVYLVPSMLGALALAGAARGGRTELERLWRFTDVASWRPKPAGK